MEIGELTAFVRVVRLGSFTKAADSLNVQRAYLSRVISTLESKLGVRLLERTTRSLSPTEVGQKIYERATRILDEIAEAKQLAQSMQAEPRGTLKLTCSVDFGALAVSQWMNAWLLRYPETRIDAEFTGRLVDIVEEGFDLAIRVGPLLDSSLIARKLGDLHYGLYCTREYLEKKSLPVSPPDLRSHALLQFSPGSAAAVWKFISPEGEENLNFEARMRVNSTFAARDAALNGLGIVRLPMPIASEFVECGRFVQILANWKIPSQPVHAIFPAHRYLTPKVRSFIDLAREEFQRGFPSQP